MKVNNDTLAKVLVWAKNNRQATVTACRLENEKREVVKQIRRFPKVLDQLLIILKLPHFFSWIIK